MAPSAPRPRSAPPWPWPRRSPSPAFAVVMPLVMSAIPPQGAARAVPRAEPARRDARATCSRSRVILPLALLAARRLAPGSPPGSAPALLGARRRCSPPRCSRRSSRSRLAGALGGQRRRAAPCSPPRRVWWLSRRRSSRVALRPPAPRARAARTPRRPRVARSRRARRSSALLCFAELGSVSPLALAAGRARGGRRVRRRRPLRAAPAAAAVGRSRSTSRCSARVLLARPRPADLPARAGGRRRRDRARDRHHPVPPRLPARPGQRGARRPRDARSDTASQYGVTSIYLLAGWFQVAPIGYGTLGLLTGALTALWFGAGYCVLRLAGTSRLLAAAALGVAVVALVFNLRLSGRRAAAVRPAALRAADGRRPRGGRGRALPRPARAGRRRRRSRRRPLLGLVARGVRLHARSCSPPGLRPGLARRRRRRPRGWRATALAAALACVARARAVRRSRRSSATGRLPDWGEYLAYLREFLFGALGRPHLRRRALDARRSRSAPATPPRPPRSSSWRAAAARSCERERAGAGRARRA